GGIVVAPKPIRSPSLADHAHEAEFRSIVNELWGSIDGMGVTEHDYGKGKVYWGKTLEQILATEQVSPDFEYGHAESDSDLVWIHRRDDDKDVYFVANQNERSEELYASFQVEGKEAELWHPDTGEIEPAEYTIEKGRTILPMHLD